MTRIAKDFISLPALPPVSRIINIKEGKFMKSTGIVRNVDELGRIVIPKEMRRKMDIKSSDPIEIYVEGDKIILTKYQHSCMFCGSNSSLLSFKDKNICTDCIEELKKN